jgi:osmotically-inducible protein OsmY
MTEQTVTTTAAPTMLIDDETLTQRVSRALTDIKPLCVLGSPLHIQVNDGVVTLRGVVATHFCKVQVMQVVRSVPGVQEVCDELWV